MALSIIVLAVIVFDLLALRFGYDSRNTHSAGLSSSWRSDFHG